MQDEYCVPFHFHFHQFWGMCPGWQLPLTASSCKGQVSAVTTIMLSLVHMLELTWGVSPQVVDRQSCSHCQRFQTSDADLVHEDPPGKWFHGYYFMWNRIGLETKVFTDLSFSKKEVSPVRIKAIFLGLWLSENLSLALKSRSRLTWCCAHVSGK